MDVLTGIVIALSLGASIIGKSITEQAGKDIYSKLKDIYQQLKKLIERKCSTVSFLALEQNQSQIQQEAIKEILKNSEVDKDKEILQKTQDFLAIYLELEKELLTEKNNRVIGVDIQNVKNAINVIIKDTASTGSGVIINDVDSKQIIISKTRAGFTSPNN